MKKTVSIILCFMLFLCLMPAPIGCTGEGNGDTLAGWNIKIDVPDGATAVLEGNEYYIYALREGEIP